MATEHSQHASARFPQRWVAVIYSILALAAFAFPAGLTGWLQERNAHDRLWLPLAVARKIEAASNAIGVAPIGAELRRRFTELVGGDDS